MSFQKFKPFKLINGGKILNKKDRGYFFFVARESCLMRDEMYNYWPLNRGLKAALQIPKGQTIEYCYDRKSFFVFLKVFSKKIQAHWSAHQAQYPRAKRRLLKDTFTLSNTVKQGNQKKILKAYLKYLASAYDFGEYIWSSWAVTNIIEPEFYKKYPEADIVSTLSQPIEFLNMQTAAAKLSLIELQKKYSWLNVYNPFDSPYSQTDIAKIIHKVNSQETKNQIERLYKNKIEFKKFVAGLPKEWRLKAEIIHKYTFLKTDRIDVWKKTIFYLRDFCQYLTILEPALTFREVSFLSIREIIDLLEGRADFDVKSIKLREKNKAAYLWTPMSGTIFYSPAVIKKFKLLTREKTGVISEVKGVVANKGLAKGRAVVINHSQDLKKVKPGDIFVARYTFPSFLPFMKICAAIVTDEGGLTSHAAIVARELNIPCIIGTKQGTKIFKDGDLIEVDAKKGFVKKQNAH